MKPLNELAKLADRVIAPGEGSAEPGVKVAKIQQSLRSWRQVVSYEICKVMLITRSLSGAIYLSHTSWLGRVSRRHPRLGCLAWGYQSIRQLRRLVESFL